MTLQITNNQFHTSQVLLSERAARVASYCSHAVYGLGVALCVVTVAPSHLSQKAINMVGGIVLFAVSNRLDKLADYAKGYELLAQNRSEIAYGAWLRYAMDTPKDDQPITIAEPIAPQPALQLADYREALKKPHLLILGETGAGKSTLATALAAAASMPVLFLDPHAKPNDWQGATVFGRGRNYREIGKVIGLLVTLMDQRYNQIAKGFTDFEPLLVGIDEFPSIVSELGKEATNSVKLLAREARKVKIRLMILSQGAEVQTLGIEGEGSIRECFAFVTLGKFASARAKKTKEKPIMDAIATASRPAMIDNHPCSLPEISGVSLPPIPLPKDLQQLLGNSQQLAAAPSDRPKLSEPLASIVRYLKDRGWVKDYNIKNSIRAFKDADTPINEIQAYLQYLEVQGHLETRNNERGVLEARLAGQNTLDMLPPY